MCVGWNWGQCKKCFQPCPVHPSCGRTSISYFIGPYNTIFLRTIGKKETKTTNAKLNLNEQRQSNQELVYTHKDLSEAFVLFRLVIHGWEMYASR